MRFSKTRKRFSRRCELVMANYVLTLEPQYLRLLVDIFHEYIPEREIWIFGSRVNGRVKPYSDIDCAIIGEDEVPLRIMGLLNDAFADSDLPYKVDLVDWATASQDFRCIIESAKIVLR
jgi:predicted nucleotidyltransferase